MHTDLRMQSARALSTSGKAEESVEIVFKRTKLEEISQLVAIAKSLKVFTDDELDCLKIDAENQFEPDADPDTMYSIFHGKELVGFLHFGPLAITDRSMMLFWIFVSPKLLGKGLAAKLVEKMEADAAQQNCRVMFIETSDTPAFLAARKFYVKMGYDEVCVIPHYYEADHGKSIFSKVY